jgi:LDH2 family malate/lactate/ureidoglycolate dehydrogenase
MKITVEQAEDLTRRALQKIGYGVDEADTIGHHLIDSELRGYGIAGLARVLGIADRQAGRTLNVAVEVTRDSPTSAQLDGKDTIGYLAARQATTMAIEKAQASDGGVAAVALNGTWYTGMLSYYAEMAAAQDLVSIIASNASPWVAPEGTHRGLLGTNPFCIGVPTEDVPIIYDVGTSQIIHAQALLAKRKNEQLPPNVAFDEHGEMTTDPDQALKGALAVWGGAKGTGLAVAVQLLGIMAGSPAMPPNIEDFGYFIMVIDPSRFGRQVDDFKREVGKLVTAFHSAPTFSGDALRMPFERSNRLRATIRAGGTLEVDDLVVRRLEELITGA